MVFPPIADLSWFMLVDVCLTENVTEVVYSLCSYNF